MFKVFSWLEKLYQIFRKNQIWLFLIVHYIGKMIYTVKNVHNAGNAKMEIVFLILTVTFHKNWKTMKVEALFGKDGLMMI